MKYFKQSLKPLLLLLGILLIMPSCILISTYKYLKINKIVKDTDPIKTIDTYELIFDDVDNFWAMYDQIKRETDEKKRQKTIQREYLDKASQGLKLLIVMDGLNAKRYSNYLTDTLFYDAIRATTLEAKNNVPEMKKSINSIKNVYEEAQFTDVYFVIGLNHHGGTVIKNHMIIEIQKNAKTPELKASTIFTEEKLKGFINFSSITPLLVHEQVHVSQKNKSGLSSLLSKTIVEGGADFVMYLLTNDFPSHIHETYKYGNENESELWNKFQEDMKKPYSSVKKEWFYNYNQEDFPPDLGYFMGFKICESYYNQATDKTKAIEAILTEKDHSKILKESKYNGGN